MLFRSTIATNTAVSKLNYRALPDIGRFIARFGFYNSEFIYVDPTRGAVKEGFKALMPRISECAPPMRAYAVCMTRFLLNQTRFRRSGRCTALASSVPGSVCP